MIDKLVSLKDSFIFLEPAFLYLLIPLAILFFLWLIVAVIKIKLRPSETYGSRYPLIGRIKFWGLFVLPAGALMILALAKPYSTSGVGGISRGDVEIILVVDRSISARGNDVLESRLEIAKREANNIEGFLTEGDKIALFIFGRESHPKTYLTRNHSTVFERIFRISFPAPGNLKGDGLIWDSDFASMLENIYQSLDRQDSGDRDYLKNGYIPKERSNRIVVLISDGEDQFRGMQPKTAEEAKEKDYYIKRLNNALKEFKRRGLKIYPVGVGTVKGVSWLSLLGGYKIEEDYPKELVEEWKGKVSRLNKENLAFLARSTGVELGGSIWTIENSSTTVRSYLRSAVDSNRRSSFEFSTGNDERQLWQYLLLVAIIILVVGIFTHPISGYFIKSKGV